MAVKKRSRPQTRASGMTFSPVPGVTLALLFLLPVLFVPKLLVEEFELPKSLLLAAGALVLLAWWIAGGARVSGLKRDPLGVAVLAMLLSALLSTVTSVRPALSLFGAPQSHAGLRTLAALAAIYFASRSLAADPRWFGRLAKAAGGAAALAVFYSLIQIARLDPIHWVRESSFEGLIRAGGTVGHANTLSAYLVTALPLVAWLAATSRTRALSLAWLGLAAVSLFIVIASLSRGAWLGLGAGLLVAALLAMLAKRTVPRRWIAAAAATVLLALAVSLLTPMRHAVLDRVRQIGDTHATTSQTRIELWRAGLRMFGDRPWTGAGLDAFLAAFPKHRTPALTRLEWGGTPAKAHNDAIQILATQGLLGGLAALAIVILTVAALVRVVRRGDPATRDAAIATGAALAGYAASSLVGFGTVAVSALAAALAGWAGRLAWPVDVRSGSRARPAWRVGAGILLAALLGFVLVLRPLRAEIYLAEALHRSSGTPARDALLEAASASAPWDPRFPAELGRSYFSEALREQDPATREELLGLARRSLERSMTLAPENGENQVLYGTVLSGQSILETGAITKEQVRAEFLKAVELDPWSPMVMVGAEHGLIAAGLTADARELALRCARTYPEYAPPLADLGMMALEQGRAAAAAETLALAAARDWREDRGQAAHAWSDLARARLILGRNEEAIAAADSALARDPNLGQAFATKLAAQRGIESRTK